MNTLLRMLGLVTWREHAELLERVESLEHEVLVLGGELEEEEDPRDTILVITPTQKYKV